MRQLSSLARSYPVAMLTTLAHLLPPLMKLPKGHDVHRTRQAIGYVAAVCLGAFITDLIVNLYPSNAIGYPIKHSVWKELGIILGCTSLGVVFLCKRSRQCYGPSRLAVAILENTLRVANAPGLMYVHTHTNLLVVILIINQHCVLTFERKRLRRGAHKSHWQSSIKELGITSVLIAGFISRAGHFISRRVFQRHHPADPSGKGIPQ